MLIIAAFYALYSVTRDLHGDNSESVAQATTNAGRIIHLERWFHVFDEARIQHWFLHDVDFVKFWNDYYASVHFVAVVAVLLLLFFRFPARYRLWRNTLAVTTALALVGFAWFPLLPPRLLPSSYHFVDTLKAIGGLWDFSSGPVNDVSNQYAAMPSLHTAWSAWSSFALFDVVRPWWGRVLLLLYPCATVFCIVVTANHYFADAAGGLVILGLGYLAGRWMTAWRDRQVALAV